MRRFAGVSISVRSLEFGPAACQLTFTTPLNFQHGFSGQTGVFELSLTVESNLSPASSPNMAPSSPSQQTYPSQTTYPTAGTFCSNSYLGSTTYPVIFENSWFLTDYDLIMAFYSADSGVVKGPCDPEVYNVFVGSRQQNRRTRALQQRELQIQQIFQETVVFNVEAYIDLSAVGMAFDFALYDGGYGGGYGGGYYGGYGGGYYGGYPSEGQNQAFLNALQDISGAIVVGAYGNGGSSPTYTAPTYSSPTYTAPTSPAPSSSAPSSEPSTSSAPSSAPITSVPTSSYAPTTSSAPSSDPSSDPSSIPSSEASSAPSSAPSQGIQNDDCFGAIDISFGTVVGSTNAASTDASEVPGYCSGANANAQGFGVWYRIDPTSLGISSPLDVILTTCSEQTTFDTQLSVYEGYCGQFNLFCLLGNDDDDSGCSFDPSRSRVEFTLYPGTTFYYVLVHGFQSSRGNFALTLSTGPSSTPSPPPGPASCVQYDYWSQTQFSVTFDNSGILSDSDLQTAFVTADSDVSSQKSVCDPQVDGAFVLSRVPEGTQEVVTFEVYAYIDRFVVGEITGFVLYDAGYGGYPINGQSQAILDRLQDQPVIQTNGVVVIGAYASSSDLPSSLPSQQLSTSSEQPSVVPSDPSEHPSLVPSLVSSEQTSLLPSLTTSEHPSVLLTMRPSLQPSQRSSEQPSLLPSKTPSQQPSQRPSERPSLSPSKGPSQQPSQRPSDLPSWKPSSKPSLQASVAPSPTP